jgi:hypothetical protein
MRNRIPIVASLFIVLAAGFASGQSSPMVMKIKVPFQFMTGEKVMPAGQYTVHRGDNSTQVLLSGYRGMGTDRLGVITRVTRFDSKQPAGSRLVFATIGGQKFLSEVWLSGMEDGYLVRPPKRSQKHDIVKLD